MLSLITGFTQTSPQFIQSSLSLRTSYLLFDEIRMAGNNHLLFDLERNSRGLSYESKIEFIIKQFALENTEEENKKDLEMMATYKKAKKFRNKSRAIIMDMIKFERTIDKIFDDMRTIYLQQIQLSHIPELAPLLQSNHFSFYNVNYDFPENETRTHSSLSKILQLSLDEDDEQQPAFLHLENDFFKEEFWKHYQLNMPGRDVHSGGFIYPVLKLHNYLWLSVADMDALKNEHRTVLQSWQQQLNKFTPLMADVHAAHQHVTNQILPAAHALQQSLNQDELIKGLCMKDEFDQHPIQLYVGMLPWEMAWAYFEFTHMAPPATMEALAGAAMQTPFVPVTLLQVPHEVMQILPQPPVAVQQDRIQAMPRKKEIYID